MRRRLTIWLLCQPPDTNNTITQAYWVEQFESQKGRKHKGYHGGPGGGAQMEGLLGWRSTPNVAACIQDLPFSYEAAPGRGFPPAFR